MATQFDKEKVLQKGGKGNVPKTYYSLVLVGSIFVVLVY